MPEIFINDVREDGDASLEPVPRITTFEELQFRFGLDIDYSLGRDRASNGQTYWAIVGFEVRVGIAAYLPQVQDANGNPLPGIVIFRHWPGAPNLPGPINPQYFTKAEAAFSNESGTNGFGYEGGSVTGVNGGPDYIWLSADPPGGIRRHSDMASRLGWHGATDHLTPNPIFRPVVKNDGIDPPPNGNGDNNLIQLFINGEEVYQAKITIAIET